MSYQLNTDITSQVFYIDSRDATTYLASTIAVPADSSLVVSDTPIYLREGDILKGKGSTTAKIDLFISFEILID